MDIEVGEYVRLKDCVNETMIARITKILEKDCYYKNMQMYEIDTYFQYSGCSELVKEVYEKDIVKHSHNIIDLIEVGDIVNGSKVIDKVFCDGYDGKIYIYLEQVTTGALEPTAQKDIETVLTKEMYKSNCYRLEN